MSAREFAAKANEAAREEVSTVYDADEVPGIGEEEGSPDFPYAVSYPDLGRGRSERFVGARSMLIYRIAYVVVGRTADEARGVAEQLDTALEGRRLSIGGRTTTPLHLESSQRVAADPDDRMIFSGTVVYSAASRT